MLSISEPVPAPEERSCWALPSLKGLQETTREGDLHPAWHGAGAHKQQPRLGLQHWCQKRTLVPGTKLGGSHSFLPRSPSMPWQGSHDICMRLLMGHFEMTLTFLQANCKPPAA